MSSSSVASAVDIGISLHIVNHYSDLLASADQFRCHIRNEKSAFVMSSVILWRLVIIMIVIVIGKWLLSWACVLVVV